MPVIAIDAERLNTLIGKTYPTQELSDALEQIGCDVEDIDKLSRYRCPNCQVLVEGSLGVEGVQLCGVCGHTEETSFDVVDQLTVIRLDLLAARPDLFDIGGLARALKGYLHRESGLVHYTLAESGLEVHVDPSVKEEESYRPYIRCAVVHMPVLDDAQLVTIMKLQENLHWGVGRARKLSSIGVYDLDTIQGPITYTTLHPEHEPFVPLGMTEAMSGREILEKHPKGVAYAGLLAEHARYPVLRDAQGTVLSMPPIINSDSTKVKLGSTRLFVDVTGPSEAAVFNSLRVLVCSLVELGGRVETVLVKDGDSALVTPDLDPRSVEIDLERAKKWLGLPLTSESLTASLERMRLGVEPLVADADGATRFRVTYPSFRSDVRHMVDIFEDLAIGFGYQNIQPALVPSMTVGSERPEEEISGIAREAMMGLGFTEVMSLPMTTEEDHFTRLRLPVPEHYPRVGNPKLKALTVVRTHLRTGVMQALNANRRRPVPIRLFEVDNVTELAAEAETGVRERRNLCFVEMDEKAGYATVRASLDALLRELGEDTPAYSPIEHPSFVPGRVAQVKAGRFSGVIGELHPEVVVGFGLDYPVSLVEVTLHHMDLTSQ